jgi:FkbM family methyltransferase
MKRILQKIFDTFGYQVVPKSQDPVLQELLFVYRQLRTGSSACDRQHQLAKVASLGHLGDLLHAHQIQTVFDVGANIGQFGLSLRKLGFKGKIVSFEPMEQARGKLEEVAAEYPPWSVFSSALGSRSEEQILQIFKDDTFSSLHPITESGKKAFGSYVRAQGTQMVKIETLDGLLHGQLEPEKHGAIMIKTDTQGHDLEVLKGGVELLKKASVVMTEAAMEVIYEEAPSFTEILAFLRQKGFKASGFYPFSHRPDSLAMIEFDAFFVRKRSS